MIPFTFFDFVFSKYRNIPRLMMDLAIGDEQAKKLEAERINTHAETTLKALAADKLEKEKGWWGASADASYNLLMKELEFELVLLYIPAFAALGFLTGLIGIIIMIHKRKEMTQAQQNITLIIFLIILTCIIPWYLVFGLSKLIGVCLRLV